MTSLDILVWKAKRKYTMLDGFHVIYMIMTVPTTIMIYNESNVIFSLRCLAIALLILSNIVLSHFRKLTRNPPSKQ